MLRVLLNILLILQIFLLSRELFDSGLYALLGNASLIVFAPIVLIAILNRSIFRHPSYLLFVASSFLFLPFLGTVPAHLINYSLYYPLIYGKPNENYKRYYYLILVSLLISLLVRNENQIFLTYFTYGDSNANLNSIFEILRLSKSSFIQFLDFSIIASIPLFVGKKERHLIVDYLVSICPIYLIFTTVFIYYQHAGYPLFSLNQSAFWVYVNRFSGIASDPNAEGLVLGLFAMILIFSREGFSLKNISLLATILLLSQFSGSRSFYMIMGSSLFIKLYASNFQKLSKAKLFIYYPSTLICMLVVAISSKALLSDNSSLRRLLDTLDPTTISKMLESRGTYFKIAWEGIKIRPFAGYGLAGFYDNQGYLAQLANIDISSWRDNSNNFYLEFILTFGLPLSILFFLILKNVLFNSKFSQDNTKSYLIVVLLCLVTGPHIYFVEFFFLVIILLCGLFEFPRRNNTNKKCIFVLSVLALSAFGHIAVDETQSLGLYPIETGNVRWLGKQANIKRCSTGTNSFHLSNFNPSSEIEYSVEGIGYTIIGTIKPGESKEVFVNSDFRFLSNHSWRPSQATGSGDNRLISLQAKWPSGFANCL